MNYKWLFLSLLFNIIFPFILVLVIFKVGGINFFWQKLMNISQNEIAAKNKNSFENMPSLENKVVFLGNSITAQGEWSELFGRGDIANRGIPGDVIDGINERLKGVLEENPAQVFIMIGIN